MKPSNKLSAKQIKQQQIEEQAHRHIEDIMAVVAKPAGFARLTPIQRQFLLAALLGAMVPVDTKIRDVELVRIKTHLATKYRLSPTILDEALVVAHEGLNKGDIEVASKAMMELLNVEDRVNLITLLWDVALCDMELAQEEEELIYKIADIAQVPRKRVIEQQARVARQGHA